MRQILSLLFFGLIISFSYVPSSLAQETKGIVVSPKRVVMAGKERIVEVLLANRGNTEQKFRISVVNREMLENGQLQEATEPAENEFFAKGVVHYSPRQVILGPKEAQKVRIMSRLKSDAPDGEYRSHLLVQEIPAAAPAVNVGDQASGALGVNVTAVFGVTIPLILRKGELSADASLSSPQIINVDGEKHLQISVNRTGNKSILGTATVYDGVQKIGLLKNVAVYMSNPSRVISIQLDAERAKNLSGKTLRVTFGAEEDNEDAPNAELDFVAR